MDRARIQRLLEEVRDGSCSVEHGLQSLATLPFEDLGFARIDSHRTLRRGFPEVVFCEGKSVENACAIIGRMAAGKGPVLATRASRELYQRVRKRVPGARYYKECRCITVHEPDPACGVGNVAVLAAGTSDIPVAKEAVLTARMMGCTVTEGYDMGVAGLHRVLGSSREIREARVIVVVAGMEGALPSVISGLVSVPVIAVPTSVGYGASFHGLAALLGMLNSCSSGVVVVNIDNGFGGGFAAGLINIQLAAAEQKARESVQGENA